MYTNSVKNVTISLPDATVEALRKKARANGKSLNAWLREILGREAPANSDWADRYRQLAEECAKDIEAANPSPWKWNREEMYEERFRRH